MTYFDDFYISTQVLPTMSLWHIVNTSAVTAYQKNIARGLLASGLHLYVESRWHGNDGLKHLRLEGLMPNRFCVRFMS
jgi:hypothetical protein